MKFKDHEEKDIQNHKFYKHTAHGNLIFAEEFEGSWYGSNHYHPDFKQPDGIVIGEWFRNYTLIDDPLNYEPPGRDGWKVKSFITTKLEEIAQSAEIKSE